MYLNGRRIELLTSADIMQLFTQQVRESINLDYKKELHLSQDSDKKEFLADVTAFANTDGGCIIYGIQELKDDKAQNTGLPDQIAGVTVDNIDKLMQQITQLIRSNTDPSLVNFVVRDLIVEGKHILILGIAAGTALPTMMTFKSTNKFWKRNMIGKYEVDVNELKHMFLKNETLKTSIADFRRERVEKANAKEIFPDLETSTNFFLHVIPASFTNGRILNLSNAENMELSLLMKPLYHTGWDTRFNPDGFATWSGMHRSFTSYDMILRNGVYEAYSSILFYDKAMLDGKHMRFMDGTTFVQIVLEKIANAFKVFKKFQIEPPFTVALTFKGMKGASIAMGHFWTRPFPTDELMVPTVEINSWDANVYQSLKEAFDIIWQSVGENQSPGRRL